MTGVTGEPPLPRVLATLAHSLPLILVASIVIRVLYLLTNSSVWGFFDSWLAIMSLVGVFALVGHLLRARLCLRCIESSPLNPELSVRRHKYFLWMTHWPRLQFHGLYFATVAVMAAGAYLDWGWWSKIPLDIMFYSFIYSVWAHHRLQPWCPYCRGWDEGGDAELVPDPDPAEGAKR